MTRAPLDPHQPPNAPVCPVGFCDSDGIAANGCEDPLDDNPVCSTTPTLGMVNGDASGSTFSMTAGRGEIYGAVLVLESTSMIADLHARVTLKPPAGADFVHESRLGARSRRRRRGGPHRQPELPDPGRGALARAARRGRST